MRTRSSVFISEPTTEGCLSGVWKLATFSYIETLHFDHHDLEDSVRPDHLISDARSSMEARYYTWANKFPPVVRYWTRFNTHRADRVFELDGVVLTGVAAGAFDLTDNEAQNTYLLSQVSWPSWAPPADQVMFKHLQNPPIWIDELDDVTEEAIYTIPRLTRDVALGNGIADVEERRSIAAAQTFDQLFRDTDGRLLRPSTPSSGSASFTTNGMTVHVTEPLPLPPQQRVLSADEQRVVQQGHDLEYWRQTFGSNRNRP